MRNINTNNWPRWKKAIFIVYSLVISLVVAKIILYNHLVTSGNKLNLIEERIIASSQENLALEKNLADRTGLFQISAQAERGGYIKNPQIVSLSPESTQKVALEK